VDLRIARADDARRAATARVLKAVAQAAVPRAHRKADDPADRAVMAEGSSVRAVVVVIHAEMTAASSAAMTVASRSCRCRKSTSP